MEIQSGYGNYANYDTNTHFEGVESDLKLNKNRSKAESRLTWEQEKYAIRDA